MSSVCSFWWNEGLWWCFSSPSALFSRALCLDSILSANPPSTYIGQKPQNHVDPSCCFAWTPHSQSMLFSAQHLCALPSILIISFIIQTPNWSLIYCSSSLLNHLLTSKHSLLSRARSLALSLIIWLFDDQMYEDL